MVSEAEKFASQDAERKEQAEVTNQAESAIFQAEKLISEHKDQSAGRSGAADGRKDRSGADGADVAAMSPRSRRRPRR